MTEAEQNALNGVIASALFGWTVRVNVGQPDTFVDPTGDEYPLAPNYTDNSGLVVGVEFKLRKRGFSMATEWGPGEAFSYVISRNNQSWQGVADTKALALCLAIKGCADANALK